MTVWSKVIARAVAVDKLSLCRSRLDPRRKFQNLKLDQVSVKLELRVLPPVLGETHPFERTVDQDNCPVERCVNVIWVNEFVVAGIRFEYLGLVALLHNSLKCIPYALRAYIPALKFTALWRAWKLGYNS
jgi:hypothetical protein